MTNIDLSFFVLALKKFSLFIFVDRIICFAWLFFRLTDAGIFQEMTQFQLVLHQGWSSWPAQLIWLQAVKYCILTHNIICCKTVYSVKVYEQAALQLNLATHPHTRKCLLHTYHNNSLQPIACIDHSTSRFDSETQLESMSRCIKNIFLVCKKQQQNQNWGSANTMK